jgi:hypothetical protein
MQKISLQQHKQGLLVCAVEMAGYVPVAKYCLILITTLKAGSVIIVYIQHTHVACYSRSAALGAGKMRIGRGERLLLLLPLRHLQFQWHGCCFCGERGALFLY